MPESIRPEKNILTFNQGLNTESSEIAFPDGFTTDERNYELLLDGSRRRRKGLAQESGGSDKTTTANATQDYSCSYVWKNVGGNPQKTFIVHKFGTTLYFTDDAETISTTYNDATIDLDMYKVHTSSVSAGDYPTQFTDGRGYLIVTGPGHYPLSVAYNATADTFTVSRIYITIRDYSDQDDGFSNSQSPTTLSDAFRYNLMNRGWSPADITAYNSAESAYPNKSVPWHKAYRRQSNASYNDDDGVRIFNSGRYAGEPASTSSAPRGALMVNVIDSIISSEAELSFDISAFAFTDNGSTWELDITTTSAHGLVATDTFGFRDTKSFYYADPPTNNVDELHYWEYDNATFTVKSSPSPTTTRVYVDYTPSSALDAGIDDIDYELGSIVTDNPLVSETSSLTVGPRACAFHDGRVFYAGMDSQDWSDYIFFSQIPDKKYKLSQCYQDADPTDPENNQMVDTDGGWLVLQGIQGVKRMLSVRSALLVFAENGIWEISGGQRGFFTPSGYAVRKITDVGCNAPYSPIALENTAIYTGPEGIYRIAPNQYTGILEATSISKDLVQTKWNAIASAQQERVLSVYDGAKKRVFFLYGKSTGTGTNAATFYYDKILILDTNIPAYYFYDYNSAQYSGIISAYAITTTDGSDQANKVKFSCAVTDATTVRTCDHAQTDYLDYDGAESPLPYTVTGWDDLGDFQRRRQAPVITVYSKRTETGYTDTGAGWNGDNESSTKMAAFWDWTDSKQWTDTNRTDQETWDGTGDATKPSISGKIDNQQQVYRHTRAFTPIQQAADSAGTSSVVDGYPVVVTRNKVRGRGRVLQLRFDGEATKDSHIMGFTTNYRVQRSY